MLFRRGLKAHEIEQPHVLKQAVTDAQMSHGQESRVTIRNVVTRQLDCWPWRLNGSGGTIVPFFCDIKPVEVMAVSVPGDGGAVPKKVRLDRTLLTLLEDAPVRATLVNVRCVLNGAIHLSADQDTRIEEYEPAMR